MQYHIPILLGTTRKNNQSRKVAAYLFEKLKKETNVLPHLLDLGVTDFPMFEQRLHEMDTPSPVLSEWVEILKNAHAVIIVAPEYKNAYPGSLKNLLDFLPGGIFRYKPIGIATVSAGPYGGTNCLAQLRLVTLSLAGLPIPDCLLISNVVEAFREDGDFKDEKTRKNAENFLSELLKYTKPLTNLKLI